MNLRPGSITISEAGGQQIFGTEGVYNSLALELSAFGPGPVNIIDEERIRTLLNVFVSIGYGLDES
jgi:hypothetical protein